MTGPETTRVVFVEDDVALREAMVQGLELEGLEVEAFETAAPALRALSPDFAGVVVSDVRLPGMDGLEFFDALRQVDDAIPVIFTTGHGHVAMAVEAMKKGATDFLSKPYSLAALLDSIHRGARTRALVLENRKLREALRSRTGPRLLGSSDTVLRLGRLIEDVGRADIDLLVTGESGSGKSFVARQIHDVSPRSDRPFVAIDAGTWAHQDAELIIFGRDPGTSLSRAGLIERATGGTLFLDDLDTMPEKYQARMLSVVEQRSYLPVGAERPRAANVRIVSASRALPGSDADLPGLTKSLFNRLNSATVALPALRSHNQDIPEIFGHFVAEFEREFERRARALSEVEWHHLIAHDWPGNLHELRAYARRFVLDLGNDDEPSKSSGTLKERVATFERTVIEDALRRSGGDVPQVGRILGLPRKTLYDKLAKYRLRARDFRAP